MLKKLTLTTLGIIVVVGALVGTKMMQFSAMAASGASMVPPPETVTSIVAQEQEWPKTVPATGTVTAVQGVTIGSEVAGKVAKITFEAGAHVQAGDLLVQLDTSTEEAQLRSAEATAELARVNVERSRDPQRFPNATITGNRVEPRPPIEFVILATIEDIETAHPKSDCGGKQQNAGV